MLKRIKNFVLYLALGLVALGLAFLLARFYLGGVFRDRLSAEPAVSQRIGAVADASVDFSDSVPFCSGGACNGVQRFVSRLHGAGGDLIASFDYNISSGVLRSLALCKPDGALIWKSEDLKLVQGMDCR